MNQWIADYLKSQQAALASIPVDAVAQLIERLRQVLKEDRQIFVFGNGGSAADAQHLAAEFVNRFLTERPPLPALALTTDSSVLTSIANDYEYKDVFAKQLRALGRQGDVALAISTSGNSSNIVAAIDACKELKMQTSGLTGGDGGKLAPQVDCLLCVSASRSTPRIQETHILAVHVICDMVERRLFPPL